MQDIKEQLEKELGGPVDTVFKSFNPEPIASATIAQVHKGVTHDGQTVAVKVQYPGLEHEVGGDWWLIHTAAKVIGYFKPEFEYAWMVPEFENNMRLELDFHAVCCNCCLLIFRLMLL